MAKKSAHGDAFLTYFDTRRRALMSCHEDGVTLFRTPFSGGWKVFGRKKPEVALSDWKAAKLRRAEGQPWWAKTIKTLPSRATLEEWMSDSVCETTEGDTIEPDGHGAGGAPSWLLALGLI